MLIAPAINLFSRKLSEVARGDLCFSVCRNEEVIAINCGSGSLLLSLCMQNKNMPCWHINSLTPGRCVYDCKLVVFKHVLAVLETKAGTSVQDEQLLAGMRVFIFF